MPRETVYFCGGPLNCQAMELDAPLLGYTHLEPPELTIADIMGAGDVPHTCPVKRVRYKGKRVVTWVMGSGYRWRRTKWVIMYLGHWPGSAEWWRDRDATEEEKQRSA
jgi:hypothetical protein